jgi:hypothetical protein
MREVFPVKYYKDEGFVERKIELDDEDLDRIIQEYLRLHAEFDFDVPCRPSRAGAPSRVPLAGVQMSLTSFARGP